MCTKLTSIDTFVRVWIDVWEVVCGNIASGMLGHGIHYTWYIHAWGAWNSFISIQYINHVSYLSTTLPFPARVFLLNTLDLEPNAKGSCEVHEFVKLH